MSGRKVVLDTVVLSNYATSDSIELLLSVLGRPVTVDTVRDELERGVEEGYTHLETVTERLSAGIPVVEVTPDDRIAATLDAGEAAALTAAIERDAVFASDDLAARERAAELGIARSGSLGILLEAVEQGTLQEPRADELLDRWRSENGYHSPVDSVSELF
jgi:predicted nucleic acid-binding protein